MLRKFAPGALLFAGFAVLCALPSTAQDFPRLEIIRSIAHGVTPSQLNLPPQAARPILPVVPVRKPSKPGHGGGGGGGGSWSDADLAIPSTSGSSSLSALTTYSSFDGVAANGSIPPDTNLAVGATQVVQTVNTEYAVYDKAGNHVFGPTAIHSVFAGLAGAGSPANWCATYDGGDPIVLYDPQDGGHWLISQMQYNNSFSTNLECIAVSRTSDATGQYNVYAFNFGNNMPDYPKFGVWSDAYYMSSNTFRNGSLFLGAKACAFDRASMTASTQTQAYGVCYLTGSAYNLLPASFDATAPPAGEPNFFLQFTASSGVGGTLNLYKFKVGDFATCSSSCSGFSFTGPTGLTVKTYHEACGGGACVPQAGTSQQLDSLADRLMYRLQYRNVAGQGESLLVNHSVQATSSSGQAGIRWYQILNPNGTPTVTEVTYSPVDTLYRWMGSIAQDKLGNMALGYSVSSSGIHPGIAYAVKALGDTQFGPEITAFSGAGSQTGYSRWGDYSSMAVDPSDGCTFWYTTEYLPGNGNFNWQTRIISFKFSGCN